MAEQLAVGDIVTLRSGGPRMTVDAVEEVNGARKAVCFWFADALAQKATFAVTSLERAALEAPERRSVRAG